MRAQEIGARVRAERQRLGLSERALADRTGLSQPTLHRIETGHRTDISLEEADRLAEGLGMSMRQLLDNNPIRDRVLAAARSSRDAEQALKAACDLIELEERLTQAGVRSPQCRRELGRWCAAGGTPSDQGQQLATYVREDLGLGVGPVADLADVIEEVAGVDVATVPLPDDVSGVCVTEQDSGITVIIVNSVHSPERQRFSLAHELCHLLVGDATHVDLLSEPPRSASERRANSFAGRFLLPAEGLRTWLKRYDVEVVDDAVLGAICRMFGVSPTTALIELKKVVPITSRQEAELRRWTVPALASRHGWRREWEADVARVKQPRTPPRLWARARDGYEMGVLGISVLARLAGEEPWELRSRLAEVGVRPPQPVKVPVPREALLARARARAAAGSA